MLKKICLKTENNFDLVGVDQIMNALFIIMCYKNIKLSSPDSVLHFFDQLFFDPSLDALTSTINGKLRYRLIPQVKLLFTESPL